MDDTNNFGSGLRNQLYDEEDYGQDGPPTDSATGEAKSLRETELDNELSALTLDLIALQETNRQQTEELKKLKRMRQTESLRSEKEIRNAKNKNKNRKEQDNSDLIHIMNEITKLKACVRQLTKEKTCSDRDIGEPEEESSGCEDHRAVVDGRQQRRRPDREDAMDDRGYDEADDDSDGSNNEQTSHCVPDERGEIKIKNYRWPK